MHHVIPDSEARRAFWVGGKRNGLTPCPFSPKFELITHLVVQNQKRKKKRNHSNFMNWDDFRIEGTILFIFNFYLFTFLPFTISQSAKDMMIDMRIYVEDIQVISDYVSSFAV